MRLHSNGFGLHSRFDRVNVPYIFSDTAFFKSFYKGYNTNWNGILKRKKREQIYLESCVE